MGESAHLDLDTRGLHLPTLVEAAIRSDLTSEPLSSDPASLPLSAGFVIDNAKKFKEFCDSAFGRRESKTTKYRGITIRTEETEGFVRVSPHIATTEGRGFLSLNRKTLEHQLDRWLERGKEKPKDLVEANMSLYLAPPKDKDLEAVLGLLEWEIHKRGLSATAMWQALHRKGGAFGHEGAPATRVALRLLGFVPVSPDGTGFVFDEKLGQVRNERHGSLSRPVYHGRLASEKGHVLSWLRSFRADLRFREDGIHTTMTLDWMPERK